MKRPRKVFGRQQVEVNGTRFTVESRLGYLLIRRHYGRTARRIELSTLIAGEFKLPEQLNLL